MSLHDIVFNYMSGWYSLMKEKELKYVKRTVEHISRVHRNALSLLPFSNDVLLAGHEIEFMRNILNHDVSKLNDTQFCGYCNYDFSKKGKNSDKIENEFNQAWVNHYSVENHHPEGFINTLFDPKIAAEIACDLCAMSQEFNSESAMIYLADKWVDSNKPYFESDKDLQKYVAAISRCINVIEGN